MPRIARRAPGGLIYHVLNRSAGRTKLFRNDADFQAFLRVLLQAQERHPLPIFAYCILSNHWHFIVWPSKDGQLTAFFRWLTHTHAMRWRVAHHTVGYGHVYQGRFKSFPIQRDDHFLTACRYVERNALTAGLVEKAQQWRYSSLWARMHGDPSLRSILSPWPMQLPVDWADLVNKPMSQKDVDRMELSLKRSRPFGTDRWTQQTAARLGLRHTLRSEGRPKRNVKDAT